LPEKSQVAANEIDELSQSSVSISEKSGKLLGQIVPSIQQTAKLVEEISASSLEQNLGASQINNAIQQLNQVTQQNAATSEEMAASAEELSTQAEQLKEIISFFKVDHERIITPPPQNIPHTRNTNGAIKKVKPMANHRLNGISLNMSTLDEEYEKY
jgi:methyl-accepting chemotaxis protein